MTDLSRAGVKELFCAGVAGFWAGLVVAVLGCWARRDTRGGARV